VWIYVVRTRGEAGVDSSCVSEEEEGEEEARRSQNPGTDRQDTGGKGTDLENCNYRTPNNALRNYTSTSLK
jgi:hypothetical protein